MLSKLPAVWTLNSVIANRIGVPPAAALTVAFDVGELGAERVAGEVVALVVVRIDEIEVGIDAVEERACASFASPAGPTSG